MEENKDTLFNPFGNPRAEQDLWRKKRKQRLGLNQANPGLCISWSCSWPGGSGRSPSTTKTGSNATGAAMALSPCSLLSAFFLLSKGLGQNHSLQATWSPEGLEVATGQAAAEGQAPACYEIPWRKGNVV